MATSRLLIRTAVKLREVCRQRAANELEQAFRNRLSEFEYQKQMACKCLHEAAAGGPGHKCAAVRRQLALLVAFLDQAVAGTVAQLQRPPVVVPDLRLLLQDLQQVEEEFGNLRIDLRQKLLCVTTEAIELEDIYLGAFEVRLGWERLRSQVDSQVFEIVALDPHPADIKPNVTHPHVCDQSLCAGEAALPIKRALEQGRLADAFCLVRSVLLHYNSDSPYVALADWNGDESCFNCGSSVDSDDFCYCEGCGHDFCDDCAGPCSRCEHVFCNECRSKCELCAECSCGTCRKRCAVCGGRYCTGCLQAEGSNPLICTRCLATRAVAAAGNAGSHSNLPPSSPESHDESHVCTAVD